MKIELKSLTLINFKGIKQLMVKFGHETSISGENATGKTTVFDAFLWLLFGKDSTDRKDFGIKTLDDTGKAIPMIDHEVIGQLVIDDRILILRRIYKEIWRKPKGQKDSVFSGHETTYYADDVPCSQKEYQEKVDSICKESLFKLLTNPEYFPNLNWTIQRGALFSLIQEITPEEIIEAMPQKAKKAGNINLLMEVLNSKTILDDYKKKIASEKNKINDELVLIPARIDEVNRGKPEPEDWTVLDQSVKDAETFIRRKEEEKTNKLSSVDAETTKRAGIQADINSLKQKKNDLEIEKEDQIRADNRKKQSVVDDLNEQISTQNDLITKKTNKLTGLRLDLESDQAERKKLLGEWQFISAEQYTHTMPGTCPTCGQELPDDFKQKTDQDNRGEWNINQQAKLENNKKKGLSIAAQIKSKEELIGLVSTEIEALIKSREKLTEQLQQADFTRIKTDAAGEILITANKDYQKLYDDIKNLQTKLTDLGPIAPVDVSDIDKDILITRSKMDENKTKLAKRETIAKADTRKAELEASQQKLSQEIADLEQVEFTIESYTRTKVSMLEKKINGLFSLVRFKMFDLQINGQLAETCECSVNGVPYSDLNNASRINAGIDIINTMSRHHGIVAPIFIDNRESVNKIIPTEAQLISLYVTKDKSLLIQ